ncbi:MAG: chemotaxis protein CheC [Oscillospiraceae bacterium]|jgi:chemotaxis protein CheC|nr:chemotaxis protein CheC [Oscillospiraceae bacterium]
MLNKFEDLNDIQLDVLKEIGNIGSGNAANALSSMIGKSIEIEMPSVKILGFQEAIEQNGSPEDVVGAVLIRLKGNIEGMVLLIIEEDFAELVLETFFGADPLNGKLLEFDEGRKSALAEVGNIMGSSYVNAISDLSQLKIDIELPSYTADMLGAIMSVPVIEFGEVGDKLLCIDKKMRINGVSVKSNMLLIPTVESLTTLFGKLGVQ